MVWLTFSLVNQSDDKIFGYIYIKIIFYMSEKFQLILYSHPFLKKNNSKRSTTSLVLSRENSNFVFWTLCVSFQRKLFGQINSIGFPMGVADILVPKDI